MPLKKFLSQIGIVTLLAILTAFLLHLSPRLASNALLSWMGIAFYLIFCLLVYFIASWAAHQPQKSLFTGLSLLITIAKMGFSVIVVGIYFKIYEPTERLFVVPFLIIYVIYTIYETYFLMKLSRVNT